MRGISNCWKEQRWACPGGESATLPRDEALAAAFPLAGMERGETWDQAKAVVS